MRFAVIFLTVICALFHGVAGISRCGQDRFSCTNGRCIYARFVCDGYDDCMDRSDERSCSEECGARSFSCDETSECINPDAVCDNFCDCLSCSDEENCYQYGGRFFNPLGLGFSLAIVVAVIAVYGIYQGVRGRLCKRRPRASTVEPQGATTLDAHGEDPPDLLDDLPPAYDTVANNSMFIIDAESLNEENVEALPSYEDVTAPGAIIINPNSTTPKPPSYDTVQLPTWTSGEGNGVPQGSERNYNVVYYNRSPRLTTRVGNTQNVTNTASSTEQSQNDSNVHDSNTHDSDTHDRTNSVSINSDNCSSRQGSNADSNSSSSSNNSSSSNSNSDSTSSNDTVSEDGSIIRSVDGVPVSDTPPISVPQNLSSNQESNQTYPDISESQYDNHGYENDHTDPSQGADNDDSSL